MEIYFLGGMMSELLRFRLARAPQRHVPKANNFISLDMAPPEESDEFDVGAFERAIATFLNSSGESAEGDGYEDGITVLGKPAQLQNAILELDRWLTRQGNRPALPSLTNKLIELSGVTQKEYDAILRSFNATLKDNFVTSLVSKINSLTEALEKLSPKDEENETLEKLIALQVAAQMFINNAGINWWKDRRNVAFSLIVAMLRYKEPSLAMYFNRLMLVFGLVELLAKDPIPLKNAHDILDALRNRTVVLPQSLYDRLRDQPTRSLLARRPGFADLYIVREEWNRYVAGEIAHIENVMASEIRERLHERTTENEETITIDTELNTLDERATETTDRFELQQETSRDSSMNIRLDGQVDTSGQYGPTKVDTHLGGGLDYSLDESQSQASNTAHETVARAIVRVERKVREARTTRNLTRIIEKNRHTFENNKNDAQHIVGIYRWVDKIKTVQIFRYPNRFLMEFQVPEPGAWLRWLLDSPNRKPTIAEKPDAFVIKPLEGGPPVVISPSEISPDNYLELGARYKTLGLEPPPTTQIIATSLTKAAPQNPQSDKAPIQFVSNSTLPVPSGYKAVKYQGRVQTWHNSLLNPGTGGPSLRLAVGTKEWMYFGASRFGSIDEVQEKNLNEISYGSIPIIIMTDSVHGFNVNITVTCVPLPETIVAWQIDTYEKIAQAYYAMKRQYDEELAAREVRAGVVINGQSPLRNAEMAREEIKKAVIEMLTGHDFTGRNAIQRTLDKDEKPLPPEVQLDKAVEYAPEIQFLEQVFEWENMTYVLYPYFWTDKDQWDKLADLNGEDPDFARFLRAGSARVVLPARPKFETAAMLYVYLGIMWGGGPAPAPDDKDYLSIADEIRAQQKPPRDGEPGESWEVRLPTTLVWLDNVNSSMPVERPEAELELDKPPKKKHNKT